MAAQTRSGEHRLPKEVNPMQILRASAVALPFVMLAAIVAVLGAVLT